MAKFDFRAKSLLRTQSRIYLIAAACVGILLVAVGALIKPNDNVLSILAVAVGGSMIGTCFTFALGNLIDAGAVSQIQALVERSQTNTLKATEDDLEPFRKVWHRYFLTEVDGVYHWAYRVLDFSEIISEGRLYSKTTIRDPSDKKKSLTYLVEGYILRDRLIIVFTSPDSSESPGIHLYPKATEAFRSEHAGLSVYQSWSGSQLTVPVLLSAEPLKFTRKRSEGLISSDKNSQLNDRWDRASKAVGLQMVRNPP